MTNPLLQKHLKTNAAWRDGQNVRRLLAGRTPEELIQHLTMTVVIIAAEHGISDEHLLENFNLHLRAKNTKEVVI